MPERAGWTLALGEVRDVPDSDVAMQVECLSLKRSQFLAEKRRIAVVQWQMSNA
jgi:hypothetical protein